MTDQITQDKIEAAAFRRLLKHLADNPDVQNIDLMITADFCRNCLADWYREAAAENGVEMSKDEARDYTHGMPYAEWKEKYQIEQPPEKMEAFKHRHT